MSVSWVTIIGAAAGVVGAAFAALRFLHSMNDRAASKRIEVKRLLDEAWDLVAGQEGRSSVKSFVADPAIRELAKRKIDEALTLDPRSHFAYVALGHFYYLCERPDMAMEMWHRAMALDGKRHMPYSYMGNMLVDQGRYIEAVLSYREAIKRNRDPVTLCGLGAALLRLDKISEAVDSYQQASALDPTDILAVESLISCYKQTGDDAAAQECRGRVEEIKKKRQQADALQQLSSGKQPGAQC